MAGTSDNNNLRKKRADDRELVILAKENFLLRRKRILDRIIKLDDEDLYYEAEAAFDFAESVINNYIRTLSDF